MLLGLAEVDGNSTEAAEMLCEFYRDLSGMHAYATRQSRW